jgi:hypothetical protein
VSGWAFQHAFAFAKAKTNQRAQKPYVLLPKSSFHCSTNAKTPLPLLLVFFRAKNYPPAAGYEKKIHSSILSHPYDSS